MNTYDKLYRALIAALAALAIGIPPVTVLSSAPQAMAEKSKSAETAKENSDIVLGADLADIEGTKAAKGTQDDQVSIGGWTSKDTVVTWTAEIPANGAYEVHLKYALATACEGTEIAVIIGNKSISAKLVATGKGWSDLKAINIGKVNLAKTDSLDVRVECSKMTGYAVMNLRDITLKPVAGSLNASVLEAGQNPATAFDNTPASSAVAAEKLPLPTAEQAAWQDLEMGVFIHLDMPVFKPGWQHRDYEHRPGPEIFNPKKLDTDQWIRAVKEMGAKYAVFVAKHGSGFMSWQSDLYPYGMKQSPYKNGQGDIVRDFVNSCRKYGIKPGIYAHMNCNGYLEVDNPGLVNRGKGGDPEKQAKYAKICEGQVTELWGNYGEWTEIWFDGGVFDPAKGGPNTLPILKKLQPKANIFMGPGATLRWVGNESGVAPCPNWSTVSEVRDHYGAEGAGSPKGTKWMPAECDVPIRDRIWLWEPDTESRLHTVDHLMGLYYRSVGHNSNLLLNANIDPDGLVPEPDMRRYKEFGDEIRRRFGKSVAETSGSGKVVELDLGRTARIDHVITMENIPEGERVRKYVIEGFAAGQWKELCQGTAIGHKKIDQFKPVEVAKIRWRSLKSVAEPRIRRLAAFSVIDTPAN